MKNSPGRPLTSSTLSFEARTIVIETATNVCSVALFQEDKLLASFTETIGRGHAERLIPMIAKLPDGGRAAAIVVGCGPGSFTGIRVGVAAARALGLAWGASVHGYSTMALMAAQAFAQDNSLDAIGVVQIGGHGELFVQSFQRTPFANDSQLESLPPSDAVSFLATKHIAGSAAQQFIAARGYGVEVAVNLTAESIRTLPAAFKTMPPSPLYVRGADARPMAT